MRKQTYTQKHARARMEIRVGVIVKSTHTQKNMALLLKGGDSAQIGGRLAVRFEFLISHDFLFFFCSYLNVNEAMLNVSSLSFTFQRLGVG